MPTSDDRREVAERLREYSNDVLKDGSLLKTLKDVTGAGSWRYVLDSLADLIDPTCRVVTSGKESMRLPHCSSCGQPILKPWLKYCPICGARVVRDDGKQQA